MSAIKPKSPGCSAVARERHGMPGYGASVERSLLEGGRDHDEAPRAVGRGSAEADDVPGDQAPRRRTPGRRSPRPPAWAWRPVGPTSGRSAAVFWLDPSGVGDGRVHDVGGHAVRASSAAALSVKLTWASLGGTVGDLFGEAVALTGGQADDAAPLAVPGDVAAGELGDEERRGPGVDPEHLIDGARRDRCLGPPEAVCRGG